MNTQSALTAELFAIIAEAGGRIAVVVRHPDTGVDVKIRADERFPSASVIKLPLLVAAFQAVQEGRLNWDQRLTVRPEDVVDGSGVLREMHAHIEVTVRDLAHLSIVVSDNTAANMLMERVGIPFTASVLSGLGYGQTRLGRKFYDFAARDAGLENLCSAGEMADLLTRIDQGTVVSPDACRQMLEILRRQAFGERIPALLPAGTHVAHKTGTITGVCHDVGVIEAPGGSIVLVVLTEGCHSPRHAERAIRLIARAAYDAFEPTSRQGG